MTQTPKRSLKALVLTVSAAAISLGAVAPVMAQTAAPAQTETQTAPAAPEAAAVDTSDAKLEAFVTALLGVEEVRIEYTPQIEAAENEEDQAALVTQANEDIIEKIEAVPDLTVDEYVGIAQAAQQDQELGARIAALVEDQTE